MVESLLLSTSSCSSLLANESFFENEAKLFYSMFQHAPCCSLHSCSKSESENAKVCSVGFVNKKKLV